MTAVRFQPPLARGQRAIRRPGARALELLSAAAGIAAVLLTAFAMSAGADGEAVRAAALQPLASEAETAPEWIVAGYTGLNHTYDSDVSVQTSGMHDFTMKDVAWSTFPFDSPIYYGVRVVRWGSGGHFGGMIDFLHDKEYADKDQVAAMRGTLDGRPAPASARVGDVFQRLEASHGHNMLTLNGLVRLPSWGFPVLPYAGLGAGLSLPHAEVDLAGPSARTYEYQYAGPVAQAVLGLEVRVARLSLFLEYKFTWAPYVMMLTEVDGSWLPLDLWRQFENWRAGLEPPGGRLVTQYSGHHLIAGAGVRVVRVGPQP